MHVSKMWRDRIFIEPFFMPTCDPIGNPLQSGASLSDDLLAFHHFPCDHIAFSRFDLLSLNGRPRRSRGDRRLTTLALSSTSHASLTLTLSLTLALTLTLTLALTLVLTLEPGSPLRKPLPHLLAGALRLIRCRLRLLKHLLHLFQFTQGLLA